MSNKFQEVIIELSYNCNLSCAMCGFGKHVNPFSKDKFMSFEKYKEILSQFGDKANSIRLNGRGESTIHPQFIEIVNHTRQQFPHLGINLFSNFSFRNPTILNTLIKNQVQLFISLDSTEDGELQQLRRGAKLSYIENNLKGLESTTYRPFIIFTIQEDNLHRIYDIACFARSYNCHIIYNTIRRDEGIELFVEKVRLGKQHITSQLKEAISLYIDSELNCICPDQLAGEYLALELNTQTHGSLQTCPALQRELCILFDGTVTPCNMFNPYVYGNIFESSLTEIWKSEERLSFLDSHKDHPYCANCANLISK
ncbi:MAG: hypothetical protein Roseis2KO_09140 [Roseivirga sp.]